MLKLKLPRWILVVMLCYSGASSSGCIDLQTSEVRQAAQRVSSINKMKILILGINQFHEKEGTWPDDLEAIMPLVQNDPTLLHNPLTDAQPGYDYVKPPETMTPAKGGNTIALYQLRKGKRDKKLNVGYLDGSVREP